ncbi:MAG: choice-of-anchor L domain-containing protein [Luteibaculaceae bacterium]
MKQVFAVIAFSFVFLFANKTYAQLQVFNDAPNNTALHLVENILIGEGVEVFDINFSGVPAQIGYFAQGGILGMDEGIIMSSGNAVSAIPNSGNASTNLGGGGDADLLQVAQSVPNLLGQTFGTPNSMNDVAIIEFKFIPTGDTVRFNFVFASREWPSNFGSGFVNTSFNDAFGFFISGPGITCPPGQCFSAPPGFGQSRNLAVIPETNIPITISSVHNGQGAIPPLNNAFFIPNNLQTPPPTINYWGYTTVLTATTSVICGETYHIKLAIGDGQDGTLDSAVLLEAQSFSSDAINFAAEFEFSANDSTVFKGCGGVITLNRSGNIAEADQLFVSTTANSEVDITDFSIPFPGTVVFEPGASAVTFEFELERNNIIHGLRRAEIEFLYDGGCTGEVRDTLVFYVQDAPFLNVNVGPDIAMVCPFDEFILRADFDTTLLIPVSIQWSIDNIVNLFSTDTTITVNPLQDALYIATITDFCGGFSRDTVSITTPRNLPFTYAQHNDTIICFGSTIPIWVEPLEGVPPYETQWLLFGDTTTTIFITPPNERIYEFKITDFCGTVLQDGILVSVQEPIADFAMEFIDDLNTQFTNLSEDPDFIVQYFWNFGDGNTSNEENPQHLFLVPDRYNVTLTITTDIGCETSITRQFLPQLNTYIPNAFTPNGDGLNDTWGFKGVGLRDLEIVIYDRWGNLIFQTNNPEVQWNGKMRNGDDAPQGVYVYRIRAFSFGADAIEKVGSVTLIR